MPNFKGVRVDAYGYEDPSRVISGCWHFWAHRCVRIHTLWMYWCCVRCSRRWVVARLGKHGYAPLDTRWLFTGVWNGDLEYWARVMDAYIRNGKLQ